jgi:predicted nucleotidyltransferase
MAKHPSTRLAAPAPRRDSGAAVPMAVIRRYARQLANRFGPDKIVLFGSHAYGTPHADSDVDLLVIMPARNQHDMAAKIRWELPAPFPMGLLVRTPANVRWRLKEAESFLTEVLTKGKVLYEKDDQGVDPKGRVRGDKGGTKSAMLQWDEPESTDGVRHRRETAS